MMFRKIVLALFCLLGSIATTSATADRVLFEQGPRLDGPPIAGFTSSAITPVGSVPGREAAEDFRLESEGLYQINSIRWWGSLSTESESTPIFRITFYSNYSGLPGSELDSVEGKPQIIDSGLEFGTEYLLEFSEPVTILGQEDYWVSVFHAVPESEPWLWHSNQDLPTTVFARRIVGQAWLEPVQSPGLSFSLSGSIVPTPSSGVIVCFVCSLLFARTRRKAC